MKLRIIREANIATQQGQGTSAGQIAKSIIGTAARGAATAVGADLAIQIGQEALNIFNLVKSRKKATDFISKAMGVGDGQRAPINIFDVDDGLWDARSGVLNDNAKAQIIKLVEQELNKYIAQSQTPPENFANNLAIYWLRSKVQTLR
jgi:hypothetical protein